MSISGQEFSIHQHSTASESGGNTVSETTTAYVGSMVNGLVSSLSVPEDRLISTIGSASKFLWMLIFIILFLLMRSYFRTKRVRYLEETKRNRGYVD